MEEKLKWLLDQGNDSNRINWALKWKQSGKRVMGLVAHNYIPEEILYAADILPWRITGSRQESAPLAEAHRTKIACRYCTHVLESFLRGDLDLLDGIVSVDLDDDVRTALDVVEFYQKIPFMHMMHLPHKVSEQTVRFWLSEIERLRKALEKLIGCPIPDERIVASMEAYSTTRQLIGELYELRKLPCPPLTGSEMMAITCAAAVMPKDEFNAQLGPLMPYIRTRRPDYPAGAPRVMVSADFLDDVNYLRVIESEGAIIAMDDLDIGSRYLLGQIDSDTYNPQYELAKYYIDRPGSNPHMYDWKDETGHLKKWVGEYKIDGVIELPVMYSFPREFMTPFTKREFENSSIPFISIRREYALTNEGQLSTRVGAFIEMIRR